MLRNCRFAGKRADIGADEKVPLKEIGRNIKEPDIGPFNTTEILSSQTGFHSSNI